MNEQTALDELCDLWEEINRHNTDVDTFFTEERQQAFIVAESALENQIPAKPIRVAVGHNGGSTDGCPCCKREFYEKVKFCPDCGKKMDWQ